MLIIGIDPGKTGCAVAIDADTRKVVGVCRFAKETPSDIDNWLNCLTDKVQAVAYLEKVGAMPNQGVSSTFAFGEAVGLVRGLLIANLISFTEVRPQAWQKALGVKKQATKALLKKHTQALAWQLHPETPVKTIDVADAVLIAHYGLLQVRGGHDA
jgi:crossover junction endodeoxyribonuclease RuvC